MYILIRETVPNNLAPLVAAHSSLACYKKFEDDEDMNKWVNGIFKKVICMVNDKEFENAKNDGKYIITTESNLNNEIVTIAFCPREKYSKQFNYFRLWKPIN